MNKYAERMLALKAEVSCSLNRNFPVTLSETQLEEVESEIGCPLPPDYREFLKDYGGFAFYFGVAFPFKEQRNGATGATLGQFYAVDTGELLEWHKKYQRREVMPLEFLPVAYDEGGNHVCLGIRKPYTGIVYFWRIQQATSPPTYDNLYKVADSFDEFMNSLYLRNESAI